MSVRPFADACSRSRLAAFAWCWREPAEWMVARAVFGGATPASKRSAGNSTRSRPVQLRAGVSSSAGTNTRLPAKVQPRLINSSVPMLAVPG